MNLLKLANPIAVTKGTFSLAGSTVGLVGSLARDAVRIVLFSLHQPGEPDEQRTENGRSDSAAATGVESGPKGPDTVPVEPHAPEEPPIDVVGQALAAEAALGDRERPDGAGLAHEPRGSSRDEEHGGTPLRRAEADGIAEEVAAALDGDVEPEEEHLTQPLIDAAEAKALAAEMKTLTRAADPHKG